MDRLQKKCFAASAGLHLLLGAILVFGPAFLTPDKAPRRPGLPNPEDPPVGQVFTLVPEQAVAAPSQPPSAAETTVRAPDQPRPSTSAQRASTTKPVLPTEAKPAAHPARSSNTRASGRDTRAEQLDNSPGDFARHKNRIRNQYRRWRGRCLCAVCPGEIHDQLGLEWRERGERFCRGQSHRDHRERWESGGIEDRQFFGQCRGG